MVPGEADRNDLDFVYVLLELKSFRDMGDRFTCKPWRRLAARVLTICIYRHGTGTTTVQEVVITVKLKGNALEMSWPVVTISSREKTRLVQCNVSSNSTNYSATLVHWTTEEAYTSLFTESKKKCIAWNHSRV